MLRAAARIPPELSVPVLAAVALALRQQKAQEASPAPAFAVATPEDLEEVTEAPPPRWRSLRACRDQGIQAGDPWIELADEGPPPQQEPTPAPPPTDTKAEDTEEEGDAPMPVAEHRFLDIDPPVDAAASGMAALRKIFEEAAALSDWQPRASEEQATKAKIVEEVAQLIGQLESSVLDVLLEDSSEGLSETAPELEPSFHGFTAADMDKKFQVSLVGLSAEHTLKEILATLQSTYSGSVGIEYMHIGDLQKIDWIRQRVEDPNFIPSDKNKLLKVYKELLKVDTFEMFLNTQYKTTKRFGVDGGEAAVAGVNAAIEKAATLGMSECVIGMPHRGRLNVLTNVVRKPLVQMFAEFKGTHYDFERIVEKSDEDDWLFAGDVKYHLGTSQVFSFEGGKTITATLEANPSHLETVNTVTLGRARAKQYYLGNTAESRTRVLPILFHGDASFAGQGVVYETMQLAHVQEFDVGGTIHVIINNQVGFTTDPVDDRSTLYTSDLGTSVKFKFESWRIIPVRSPAFQSRGSSSQDSSKAFGVRVFHLFQQWQLHVGLYGMELMLRVALEVLRKQDKKFSGLFCVRQWFEPVLCN
ncbi:ogdh [Symbiodinium sp. CCMP2592]|nr:ogdh [Symbiodinium sp. CCMP2592]